MSDAAALSASAEFTPLITDRNLRNIVFLILMAGLFMATLDNQIVSTALPTIVGEFGALERFGWVGSAYLLATCAVMPIYGKLGDLFGRKYVMIISITLFVLGSLVCGLAQSMNQLIAARVLQGLGGGGIMVSIFSINADLFPPRERAKRQSYSSLMIMVSGAVGPTLGGAMSDHFGWRSIFLINLPLGILVVAALAFFLPYRKPHRRPVIDYAGAILLAVMVASIVMWADSGQIFGSLLSAPSLAVLGLGMVSGLIWIKVESRAPEPIIPLSLFQNSSVVRFMVIALTSGAFGIGIVNYVALYLQTTTGFSPSVAGLFFIAMTGGIAIGSVTAGRLIASTGRLKIFSMIGCSGSALALFAFSQAASLGYIPLIIAIMLLHGISIGFGQQVPVIGTQNVASPENVGAATGAITLMRLGGASLAISIYGAVISSGIAARGGAVPGVDNIENLTPAAIAALAAPARAALAGVYETAFTPLFLTAAFIAVIGLVSSLTLKDIRLPTASSKTPVKE
jgi:EmrB/QacA subfamily drug resistance transporter